MAALHDVVDTSYGALKSVRGLKIWSREVGDIKQIDLILLAKNLLAQHNRQDTIKVMDYVTDSLNRAKMIGLANARELQTPFTEERVMTESDLVRWLSQMDQPRRNCFLFALLNEMRLGDAMGLTWKQLLNMQGSLSSYSLHIAQLMPRHIHSDLVFYELKGRTPVQLSGLEFDSLTITGLTWNELIESSRNFIPDASEEVSRMIVGP